MGKKSCGCGHRSKSCSCEEKSREKSCSCERKEKPCPCEEIPEEKPEEKPCREEYHEKKIIDSFTETAFNFWLNAFPTGDQPISLLIPQGKAPEPVNEPIVGFPIRAIPDTVNNNNRAITFRNFRLPRGKYILETTIHYVLIHHESIKPFSKYNIKWLETFAFVGNNKGLPPNLLPETPGVKTAGSIQKKITGPRYENIYKNYIAKFRRVVRVESDPAFWVGFTRSPDICDDYPREVYITGATFILSKFDQE